MAKVWAWAGMIMIGVWLAGCQRESEPTPGESEPTAAATGEAQPAPAAKESPAAKARTIFEQRCQVCHGDSGQGNGPGAAALNPKPRNYTDQAWQKSVTDDELKKIIIGGGASVGKSPAMPPNPDLKDEPKVVDELVKIVRGFGKG